MKKNRFGLLQRLLVMSLGPILILSIVLSIYANKVITNGMQGETLTGLKNVCITVNSFFDQIAAGDYYLDDNGDLCKGEVNISKNEELLDSFVKDTDMALTIFYGDTRMATTLVDSETNKRILGTKADESVTNAVLKEGKTFTSTDLVIDNTDYYAFYIPIKNTDGKIIGMCFAGSPSIDVNSYINKTTSSFILICIIILIVFSISSTLAALSITHAMRHTESVLSQLAAGKLGVKVAKKELKRTDEIGKMSRALQNTAEKLNSVMNGIADSAQTLMEAGKKLETMTGQTSLTADEISRAVEEVSKGAVAQAEDIETATLHISDMGDKIVQIVSSISDLYSISKEMDQAQQDASDNMNLLTQSNDNTTAAILKVAQNVEKTNASVREIAEALSMITDIADETNLLSLNASIEAARAGEAGRGFAVVAAQIQKLSEESNSSALKIEEIINTLSADSDKTMQVMQEVQDNVHEVQDKLKDTKEKYKAVELGIKQSNVSTDDIQNQASNCDNSRASVVDVIQNLSALSEENAASTEETTASMQDLNTTMNMLAQSAKELQQLAESLENEVGYFECDRTV